MKKLLVFLAFAVMFTGCTGKIIIKHDDFKNADVISMELRHSPREFAWAAYATADYIREVDSKGAKPTIIDLALRTAGQSPNLEPNAFVKVDEKNYEVALLERTGETETEVSVKIDTTTNEEKVVESNSAKIFRAKLPLTAEIEKNILDSKKLEIRIYLGKYPSTYIMSKDDLDKIKKFLLAKPGDKK